MKPWTKARNDNEIINLTPDLHTKIWYVFRFGPNDTYLSTYYGINY